MLGVRYCGQRAETPAKRYVVAFKQAVAAMMGNRRARTCLSFLLSVNLTLMYILMINLNDTIDPVTNTDDRCMRPERFTKEMFHACIEKPIKLGGNKSMTLVNTDKIPETKSQFITKIPKRIHQIYCDYRVPENYQEHILSWKEHNPDFEYFFWTDEDAERLIRERYPRYINLFNKYEHILQKSDVARYFILHEFGGVYADMDMHSVKSMAEFLSGNTSIFVAEPYVQTKIIYNRNSSLTNCIMASVAHHPFLTHVIERLGPAFRNVKHNWDILYSTGPFFLDDAYKEYVNKYPACVEGSYCHVYQPDFKYLTPTFDKVAMLDMERRVREKKDFGKLREEAQQELSRTSFFNDVPPEAYTYHLWLHLGWFDPTKLVKRHIETIVPGAITYDLVRHQ